MSDAPFYSCNIPVRWGDMDAFGHVNNSIYFRYIEEARFQMLLDKGITSITDSYPVLLSIGCTFLKPVFHPDTLRIDIFISEPGRSSFIATYKLYSSTDNANPCSEGESKIVWISKATGRSMPLPDAVREWFSIT